MESVQERADVWRDRHRRVMIDEVLELMSKSNITLDELREAQAQYVPNLERLTKLRTIQKNKAQHAANLKKAQDARRKKDDGK